MIKSFTYRSAISLLAVFAGCALVTQVSAQAPTNAQRNAIKSSCRSDYMAHCASVPPGGAPALQCLQKNMTSLSQSCQAAVKAVSPSAEAKPVAAPAAAESKPAAETKPAPETKPADEAAKPAEAKATAPAQPALVLRPLRPLEELRIVNAACGVDARTLCSAIEPGGGRIARCLAANAASLSPACRRMLARFAAR